MCSTAHVLLVGLGVYAAVNPPPAKKTRSIAYSTPFHIGANLCAHALLLAMAAHAASSPVFSMDLPFTTHKNPSKYEAGAEASWMSFNSTTHICGLEDIYVKNVAGSSSCGLLDAHDAIMPQQKSCNALPSGDLAFDSNSSTTLHSGKIAARVPSVHGPMLGDPSTGEAALGMPIANASIMQQRHETSIEDSNSRSTEQCDAALLAIRAAGALPVCPRLASNLFAAPTGQLMLRKRDPQQRLSLDSPLCNLLACCIVATLSLFWSAVFAHGSWRRSGLLRAFTLLLLLQGAAWLLPAAEAARLDNAAPPFGKAVNRASHSQVVRSEGASVHVYEADEARPPSSAAASPPSTKGDSSPSPPAQTLPPSGLLPAKGANVGDAVKSQMLPSSNNLNATVAMDTSLAQDAVHNLALGLHGRGLQVTVSDVTDLISKLADPSVSRIVVASGHYALTAELSVTRAVTIEADVPGGVVLDAQASSSAQRRVLNVNPASAFDTVELIGLSVTGGHLGKGGGIQISNGQVTLSQVKVYSNAAAGVSARLLNPP